MKKKSKLVGVHVSEDVYIGLQELRHKIKAQFVSDIIRGLIIQELESYDIFKNGELNTEKVNISDYHRQ